jgi:hypothetical protein
MRQWIRSHLTYANVISTLALFLVLAGGSAVALNGSNTVQSDDLGPGAQVKAPDVADNAVNSADVVNESLTGADIKNRSGVDTCQTPLTVKLGPICAGSDAGARDWVNALTYCTDLGLRLPTHSEAVVLAKKFDVPGVSETQSFWTDEETGTGARTVNETGGGGPEAESNLRQTVCVTDPEA